MANKQKDLKHKYNQLKSFDGVRYYYFDGTPISAEQIPAFMESFAETKRKSNKGDTWHVMIKNTQFLLCTQRKIMYFIFEEWEEIGNIEL